MGHQGGVTLGQLLAGGVVVHRRAETVGSMTLGHPAELPETLLIPSLSASNDSEKQSDTDSTLE
jgi:hypothetical protein